MFINSYGNLPNLSMAGAYSNSGPSQCLTPPPCGFDCTDQFMGSMALAASIQLTPPAECPPAPCGTSACPPPVAEPTCSAAGSETKSCKKKKKGCKKKLKRCLRLSESSGHATPMTAGAGSGAEGGNRGESMGGGTSGGTGGCPGSTNH